MSKLEKTIDSLLLSEGLTGASWSVVSKDSIMTAASGLKNSATNEQFNPADHVHIGSITKTILATGILRLVSQDKLNLDTPVEELVENIKFNNPWEKTHPVLLRHLLDHTSGIEDARFWQVFSEQSQPNTPLAFVFTKSTSVLTVRTKPGARFSYSNMGFTMLGMIIESITKESYESYLDLHLLKPLGMVNSTFQYRSQAGDSLDAALAMGHFDNGTTQATIPMYLRPAGQFTTTAHDMALFAQFLMGDGSVNKLPFINTSLLHQMGQSSSTEANKAGLNSGYHFGLSRRDRHGAIGYYHSGNTIGYRAVLYLFPQEEKAFFLSINTDSETANYESFTKILIEALALKTLEQDISIAPDTVDLSAWEGYYILSPRRFEMFDYIDYLFAAAKVKWDENQLSIIPVQSNAYNLVPIEGNLLRREDRVNSSHVLYTSESSRLISDGLKTYEKVNTPYFLSLWLSLLLGLIGLVILFLKGLVLLIQKRLLVKKQPLAMPFLSLIGLGLPIPFFFNQSFLALGDLTLASAMLAIVTGLLPIAMLVGLYHAYSNRGSDLFSKLDITLLLSILQWTLVLGYWGMLPFRLWV
jgi:CubicO group peptidase (beta-lactamase class C family)